MHNNLLEDPLVEVYKKILSQVMPELEKFGLNSSFVARYLANAVLSFIEEKEQEFILGMRYDEWVKIGRKELEDIADRIAEYIIRLIRACRGVADTKEQIYGFSPTELRAEVKKLVLDERVVEKTVCYLYKSGIYDDGISTYVLVKDIDQDECESELLRSTSFEVRSRFIEIAKYIYNLKQRFPDKTVYESPPLVDRVFAYAEPRYLPVGGFDPYEAYDKELDQVVREFYRKYNTRVLGRTPGENEFEVIRSILREFFNYLRVEAGVLFYRYQVAGIKSVIESAIKVLDKYDVELKVIEAPTGAGKTEIFVISILVMALVRKVSHYYYYYIGQEKSEMFKIPRSPIAIVAYPRLALAYNQVERVLKYLHVLNTILKNTLSNASPITLSMNYTDVRFKSEYIEGARRAIESMGESQEAVIRLPYGVKAKVVRIEDSLHKVVLTHVKCHNNAHPSFIYNSYTGVLETRSVLCGDERVDYIKLTKDDVKEEPGDIHVTLLETLRNNLLSKSWRKIFGDMGEGPLVIVLDEIHTYVGIQGARYAYVLRRVIALASHLRDRKYGFVVIGVSATIPNPGEFIPDLFFYDKKPVDQAFIRPSEDEVVPLGNEYFYIIVPTSKYEVDFLSVSIQSVMSIYFNIPGFVSQKIDANNEQKASPYYKKKAIVFIDNLDVLSRARKDLDDAFNRGFVRRRNECEEPYGIQDLRNPQNKLCFKNTILDYGDNAFDTTRDLARIHHYRSWRDGELWWPYSLEYNIYKKRGYIAKIGEFTSRSRETIEELDIVVATSSLEVGIDYRDVVFIYQHGAPLNMSSLVQRAGRSGRKVFQNPLTRTVVAIQLSPDIPTQVPYLEIFTRVRSLRDAIYYDKLHVPTANKYVVEQTLIEVALDYLIATDKVSTKFASEEEIEDFECRVLPERLNDLLGDDTALEYLDFVISPQARKDEISDLLSKLISEIEGHCG